MRGLALVALVLLAACGRPLTTPERAFLRDLHGTQTDPARVRLVDWAPTRAVTFRYQARPRTTCRERIFPPVETETVTAKPAAVSLFNHVLFDRDWYLDDYVPDYPERIDLVAAMLFAHEMTHVWQWQNRARTGYHPLKAAAEHDGDDPYLIEPDADVQFLDLPYEQQGSVVEEYICCRALAPRAPRTARLHDMLRAAMPVRPIRGPFPEVRVPWKDVELKGICG